MRTTCAVLFAVLLALAAGVAHADASTRRGRPRGGTAAGAAFGKLMDDAAAEGADAMLGYDDEALITTGAGIADVTGPVTEIDFMVGLCVRGLGV